MISMEDGLEKVNDEVFVVKSLVKGGNKISVLGKVILNIKG